MSVCASIARHRTAIAISHERLLCKARLLLCTRADHIEFDAQIPASRSPGEAVQSNDGRRLRTADGQKISGVRQQRQNVHLP